MSVSLRRSVVRAWLSALLAIAVSLTTLGAVALAPAVAETTGPTIASDQADYPPGALVTLTGDGWLAGEAVHIVVNDDQGRTWERSSDVTADETGAIVDVFNLPDWFVATYAVVATGEVSGVARTTFTDGNVADDGTDGVCADVIATGCSSAKLCGVDPQGRFPLAPSETGTRSGRQGSMTPPGVCHSTAHFWLDAPACMVGRDAFAWTYLDSPAGRSICVDGSHRSAPDGTATTGRPQAQPRRRRCQQWQPQHLRSERHLHRDRGAVPVRVRHRHLQGRHHDALQRRGGAGCTAHARHRLTAGSHGLTAAYSGATGFVASTSTILTQR